MSMRVWLLHAFGLFPPILGLTASAQTPASRPLAEAADEAAFAGEVPRDHPEWLDMYASILNDEPMDSSHGWFRTSTTRTRFDWTAIRSRLDRDGDGEISGREYPGGADAFSHLDRNDDGVLTPSDFDFTDLEVPLPDRPSRERLLQSLFRQELGSLQNGPGLREQAPNFTLRTADGRESVTLSDWIGPKPIVLIFGNLTSGSFRQGHEHLKRIHQRYGDRAAFLMVYVRESHPSDGWRPASDAADAIAVSQPSTYGERAELAERCGKRLGLGFPILVDSLDDAVGLRYSGTPNRLYLIDRGGEIAFKNARGPFGFKPDELEQSLILLLQMESASKSSHSAEKSQSP